MTRFEHILCPIDFSTHAAHALEVAIDLARPLESTLCLVHVVEPPVCFGTTPRGLSADLVEMRQKAASAQLAPALDRCHAAGLTASSRVEAGAPAALKIVELSEQADLIVLGSRGSTAFEPLLAGSVAERVVRYAKCPVLVVRPSPAERAVAAA